MTLLLPAARRMSAVLALIVCSGFVGAEVIRQPTLIRFLAAACLGLAAVVAAMQWPRAALVAALALLPYLALSRRLLLEFTPWKSTDPLLLVAPAVLILALTRLYVIERRPMGDNRISKLMVFLIALTIFEVVNPRGGGLSAGIAALLFTAIPLLWFFAGKEFATPRAMRVLLASLVLSACLVAVYGLEQTWSGMPSWDEKWVQQTGYAALTVGYKIRAFGTFSSAAEYASFLGVAIVISVAFALDRRPYLLPAVPLLAIALFYESSRGILVTTVVAVIVVIAARTGTVRRAALVLIVLLGGVVMALVLARGALQSASYSSDPLVSHQVSGFVHPLDKNQSTLPAHFGLLENGFTRGVLDPIGRGTASTNIAGAKLGGAQASGTEIDLSNEFVALGTFGGLAYLALLVLALTASLRHAVATRDAASLSVLGMLIALVGQWLNGGFYALAPLIWFSIGFVVASEYQRSATATSAART